MRHGAEQGAGGLLDLVAARAIGLGGAFQHAAKARAAHGIFRREVRAAVKRPAVGEQKDSEGPATPAGHGGDGGLVARIHVGALVAIHFDGDVQPIDQLGETRIVVALAIDDVAPVAPDRADVQEDGLVFGARASEGLLAPFVPSHGLVRCGMQIGACGVRQAVGVFLRHKGPFTFS